MLELKNQIDRWICLVAVCLAVCKTTAAQQAGLPLLVYQPTDSSISVTVVKARPLDHLSVVGAPGKTLQVADGNGNIYLTSRVRPVVDFIVAGMRAVAITGTCGSKNTLPSEKISIAVSKSSL